MLITKNKSKSNGKTYINIVLKEDMIKSTKNPEYKKISVLADYKVGLSDKTTSEIGKLDISKLKISK